MKQPNETKELLNIIKNVLHKQEDSYGYREDIDYGVLYMLANQNGVANTIAEVICSNEKISDSVKNKFENNRYLIITRHVLCDKALQELFVKLDNHKVRALFLKRDTS